MAITIKLRRSRTTPLSSISEVPKEGEAVYSLSEKQLVIGDGTTQAKSLPRFYAKTWQGDIIAAQYGGTGNNSGFIRAGLASGTTAGNNSTAEGSNTQSTGRFSHTEGLGTIAKNQSQHVFGQYNVQDPSSNGVTSKGTYVEIVGNGTGTSARSNARTLDWSGNETLAGKLTVGSDPTNNLDVATKQYVDNNISTGVTNAINNLDVNSVGGTGKYISAISQSNGKISATASNTTVTNATTGGTTAGPSLTTTVNGVASTVTLPSASSTASGVVTTGNQTFKGIKTFYNEGTTADDVASAIKFENKDTTTGQTYSSAGIFAYQDHAATTYGLNMVIVPGGNLIIGSGESGTNLYNALKSDWSAAGTETTLISADTSIYLYANAQSIGNRVGVKINTSGALVPVKAEETYDNMLNIGASTNKWKTVYATTFDGNATSATLAASATKLQTGRTLKVNLASTSASTAFNGTANITDIGVSGTLSVSNGGTGLTTSTYKNAVVIGNGTTATSAFQTVRTASGALYATAQDAKPSFGTLPVAQGGTGLTSSPSMLTNLASTSAQNVLQSSPRPGVTGTLPVSNGGTGATTFTSGALLIGNGTSAVGTRAITNNTSATAIGTGTNIPTMNTIYNGLPKINNAHNYTSSSGIYAPPNGGNSGDVLLSMGPTATPVWGQLAMSFLNSSDLDNLYVWDILSTASTSSFYVSWEPGNNTVSVTSSKKYIHIYKSATATSASALTISSWWKTVEVPSYGYEATFFENDAGQEVYLYPTTSSTHTASVSSVSPSNVFRINAGASTYMSTGYVNSKGPYVRFSAHNVTILTGQSVNCTTETNTLTSHTNSRSGTGLTLCRGSLRQILLGTRMGSYVGTYTDVNNETSSSYTIQFPLLPGSSSTCWIPRVLLISGQFTWGSAQTPTRPCSLLIDCHNLIGNQAGNFDPIVISSLQTYTGSTSSSSNIPAVSWKITSSKIRGITLTGYANIFNSSGNTYQYYALA